ncbi:tetratricopeptide repeat protein [Zunongwangia sp.]|uniref:SH3 domain-containing protein n=1 Tax=Zunongwangia sp. TaxID=1965325 RepID=UPI003AA815FA
MKKILILCILFCNTIGFGQNQELFDKANQEYADGAYEKAIADYNKIITNGDASVAVYYNLGNAHYKLNHIAPSIYNFEKALQLAPNDADVKNNIEFARNMAIDAIKPVTRTGLSKTVNNIIATFSYNTWAMFAVVAMFLFAISFLLYYYTSSSLKKRILFALATIFILGSITSIIFAYNQHTLVLNTNYGIVFQEEAPVRSEPNLRGNSSFILHEGTKAEILEKFQDWYKIEIADGKQGWTKKENIRKL